MSARRIVNSIFAVAIVMAFMVLALRPPSAGRGIEVERRHPPPGVDEIRVAVAGAVAAPGVVPAEPGERVSDVIARAGGAASDANLDAVNLSRRVRDEDRVVVPRHGDSGPLVDLNAATADELAALPAIGPAYADAIVRARAASGPFASTDELIDRRVIPERTYEQIRDLVTVR
ncbi:MAG: ComEA family DNA-binding protein [Dehalococcoidia bacterium]